MRTTVAVLVVMLGVFWQTPQAWAVREGGQNGNILAEMFEENEQWHKAALWREAIAVTAEYVSKPLLEDQIRRARLKNDSRELLNLERDLKQVESWIVDTRRRAARDRARARKTEIEVEKEKQRIQRFLDRWIPYYPRALVFSWGLKKMRRKADRLLKVGRMQEAMSVEKEHWQRCADWYEATCLEYYKTRDRRKYAHFKEVVSLLRRKGALYAKKERILELDIRDEVRKVDRRLRVEQGASHELGLKEAVKTVRGDPRMSEFRDARFSGWHQGAYWMVHVHRGNKEVALVIVDDETAGVVDIRWKGRARRSTRRH